MIAGLGAGTAGHRPAAGRQALTELWDALDPGDAPARCILAHFLADAQDGLHDEIAWDEVSLAESAKISDDDLRAIHPAMHVAGFMSSLHLNLADGYRRLGRFEAAGRHLESSLAGNGALTGDGPRRRVPRLDGHWATACRRGDRGTRQRVALLVAVTVSAPHCPSRRKGRDVAERRRHQQEPRVRQLQQRHPPRPAAVGSA